MEQVYVILGVLVIVTVVGLIGLSASKEQRPAY